MTLDYAKFKELRDPAKLCLLTDLNNSLTETDGKELKYFLNSLWHDKAESSYYRKKCLELSAKSALLCKIPIAGVIDRILDVDAYEDHFIIIQAIQLARRLYKQSDLSIVEWLSEFLLHTNPEISSEVYYGLGRIHFDQAASSLDSLDAMQKLIEAEQLFNKSSQTIENRTDAYMFSGICSLLLLVLSDSKDGINTVFNQIVEHLIQFVFFSLDNVELSSYVNLINALSVAKSITLSQPEGWIEFKNEFNDIFIQLQAIEATVFCKELFPATNPDHIRDVKSYLVNHLLVSKLQNEIHKLKNLYELPDIDQVQKNLIGGIIQLISEQDHKKKDRHSAVKLVAQLYKSFPVIPLATIQSDVENSDLDDPETWINLLTKYLNLTKGYNPTLITTGFQQGDEIINMIGKEIRQKLPLYPIDKYLEFCLVLRDLTNYFINAVRGGKSRFSFLFKSNALENEMQDNLLTFLQAGERADKYIPEVKEFADGGRVDIIYTNTMLQIPIELKRSFDCLNWENVEQSYIAQAQTYAYTRDQISFFMVLDLSNQDSSKPEANIRDLFKVIHLDTRQNTGNNFPDYVVAFILPGNKLVPSERSRY